MTDDKEVLRLPITNVHEAMRALESIENLAVQEQCKPVVNMERVDILEEVTSLAVEARNLLKGLLS